MVWIALADHESHDFSPRGLDRPASAPKLFATSGDAILPRGSLVIETRLPISIRPKPLVRFDRTGDWPFHLSLQSVPRGGLTLVLDQGGEILHQTINHSDIGRTDVLRITYSWDAPGKRGQLALERTGQDHVVLVPLASPKPLRVIDAQALMRPGADRYLSPDVLYLALSSGFEPVGPMPSLLPGTPIATPGGYRAVRDLQRGDLVLTPDGQAVPVLHNLSRTVPARGGFSPVRLRAPYFGLQRDILVAPSQRLVLSGSEVEYLFGHESVLIPARHLAGGPSVIPVRAGPTITYSQLLLPGHEPLTAAGAFVESLNIGRLRRKPHHLRASLLAGLDRRMLPDHGRTIYPVLKAFDAIVLAEQRAA